MEKNSTTEDIVNGNGLKPLQTTQPTPMPVGVTIEQRGHTPSGIRKDIFTRETEAKKGEG